MFVFSLFTGMVLQNNEFDEGIGDTDSLGEGWESRSFNANFKTLIEVLRFCETRLLKKNILTKGNHYSSVTKALYLEVSELKAFLGHVLHNLDSDEQKQNHLLCQNEPNLAKKHLKEWARLWIEVMEELRQKTKEIQIAKNKDLEDEFVPETEYYKCTPFTKENLNNTEELQASIKPSKSLEDLDTLPSDAESRIFDFLKSRVSSHDYVARSLSPDSLDLLDDSRYSCDKEKKLLGVHNGLVRKISDWDQYSLDDTLEKDFLDGSYISDDENDNRKDNSNKQIQKRMNESYDVFSDSTPSSVRQNISLTAPPGGNNKSRRISKSEMCLHQIDINEEESDIFKIGASLTEIFKIRQELTRAELELSRDLDLVKLKKCFGCRENKFTFFQRVKLCACCKKKYCANCITENIPIPPSLTETLPPNVDITHSANQTSSLIRSKSMLHVGPSTTVKQLPWQRAAKVKGVRLSMCEECHVFVDSIKTEREKIEWKVQLELDL